LQSPGQLGVVGRDVVGQESGALREANTGDLDDEVLEQVGHPGQWSSHTGSDLRERPIEHRRHDGVENRVETPDALDPPLHQLDRGYLTPPHQVGLADGVQRGNLRAGIARAHTLAPFAHPRLPLADRTVKPSDVCVSDLRRIDGASQTPQAMSCHFESPRAEIGLPR
jgi:hypothetical protein